jgi:hypothetical protein
MTTYRDRLVEDYGTEIGSIVGCGLDRLERTVTHSEILRAIDYYNQQKDRLDAMPIGARRQEIADLFR